MELITFNCSACQQVLKVSADNAGKQAKCPRCGAGLVIPNASAPGPQPGPPPIQPYDEGPREPRGEPRGRPRRPRRDDDYSEDEDRPRRPRRREEDEYYEDEDRRDRPRRREERYADEGDYDRGRAPGGMSLRKKWDMVRIGILLVAISACILAGAGVLEAIADLIRLIADIGGKGSGTAFKVVGRIGHGLAVAGGIVALVGYVLCVFVPNRHGTLVLAIVALALGGINLIFNILCKLIPMFKESGVLALVMPGFGLVSPPSPFGGGGSLGGAFALSIFVVLFYFAELIIFPLFLWAVAHASRARWAAGNCIGLVIFASVSAGVQLLNLVMVFVTLNSQLKGNPSKGLAITTDIISLLAAFAFIGQMIWYILLLFRMRDVVEA
jgi:hypothetical protein